MTDRSSSGVQIARNYFFVFLAQLVRLGANVIIFVGIARLYGADVFGQFTTAHTLSTLFILIADFGFDTLLASEISRHRGQARDLAHVYLTMKLIFAFSSSVVMVLVAHGKRLNPETVSLVHIFAFYVFFAALTNFFFALFKSFEEMHHEVRISFFMNLMLFSSVVALGLVHAPILWLAVAFVGSRVFGVILSLPTVMRLVRFRVSDLRLAAKQQLKGISIFGFSTISGFLFFTQDTLMLAWWAGAREVGIYQAAMKIVSLSLLISDIVFYSLLLVLNRFHSESRGKWVRLIRILHKFLVSSGVIIGFTLLVLAEPIISLVMGLKEYGPSVAILRVFGGVVFFRYLGEAAATSLTTSGRAVRRLVVMAIGVGLNIVLNFFAIPAFGAFGASLVSLVTNVAVVGGYFFATGPEEVTWLTEWRNYIAVVVAGLCALIAFLVPDGIRTVIGLAGGGILGAVSYLAVFSRDERQLLVRSAIQSVMRRDITSG